MHSDYRRGMRLAVGARVGSMLFTLSSLIVGTVCILGGIFVVSLALVLVYGGR